MSDTNPSERSSRMLKLSRNHLTVVAATAAAALAGTAVAGAADNVVDGTTSRSAPAPARRALTGTTKDKVQAAALAKVAGTVLRVETDNGGVYEAHIRKADGTEVEVKVNKAFAVTAVEEFDGVAATVVAGTGPVAATTSRPSRRRSA